MVARTALGEVLRGVVDDMVGADRADQLDGPGAGDAGDCRAEGLGDLHRDVPTPPEAPLIRLWPGSTWPWSRNSSERGDGGDADRRSLLEGQATGFMTK